VANSSRRQRLREAQVAAQQKTRIRRLLALGVVVGAVAAIFVMIWMAMQNVPGAAAATTPPNATAAKDGIVVNPGKATPGAPVVTLYSDYQCVHCVEFEEKYGLPLAEMAARGEIQLVYGTKVFLDRGVNEGLSHKAAVAAACSDVAGSYNAYHQAIFAAARNGAYTDALLRTGIPASVGIEGSALTSFQQCYDTRAMLGFVNGVEEQSVKNSVTGTPTFKINGKDIPLPSLPADDGAKIRDFILANR